MQATVTSLTGNPARPLQMSLVVDKMRVATLWSEAAGTWNSESVWEPRSGEIDPEEILVFNKGNIGFPLDVDPDLELEITEHGVAFLRRDARRVACIATKDTPLMRWSGGEHIATFTLNAKVFWPDWNQRRSAIVHSLQAGDVLEFPASFGLLSYGKNHLKVAVS